MESKAVASQSSSFLLVSLLYHTQQGLCQAVCVGFVKVGIEISERVKRENFSMGQGYVIQKGPWVGLGGSGGIIDYIIHKKTLFPDPLSVPFI